MATDNTARKDDVEITEETKAVTREPLLAKAGKTLDCANTTIDSARVKLISLDMKYAEDVFLHFNASIIKYMFPKVPERIEETIEFLESALKNMKNGIEMIQVITRKDNGEFLGLVGLHSSTESGPKKPHYGIWVKKTAHGRGYGMEAIMAFHKFCEENLDFTAIIYPVDRRNFASRRIPEALGGTIMDEKVVTAMDGRELDEVVYYILPRA